MHNATPGADRKAEPSQPSDDALAKQPVGELDDVFAELDKVIADTPLESPVRDDSGVTAIDFTSRRPTSVSQATRRLTTMSPATLTALPAPASDVPIDHPNASSGRIDLNPASLAANPPTSDTNRHARSALMIIALVALAVVAAVQAVLLRNGERSARAENLTQAATGLVTVDSTPRGATVAVNGQSKGITPLTVTLEPGNYSVEVVHEGSRQTLPVTVAAGSRSSQHILFGAISTNRGRLQITSQPPGAKVTIDGNSRGVTPLTLTDITPGPHLVVLDSAQGTTRQTVMVEDGGLASLSLAMPTTTGVSGGFLRVTAPFDVQLLEDNALIGSSDSARIMLPSGRHTIEVVNSALGYRSSHTVQISPGGTADLRVTAPSASVDVNAIPWADVTIGGRELGITPLGSVPVPIGTHEIIYRHPQLGERRMNFTVTVKGPNRVSVNMAQK